MLLREILIIMNCIIFANMNRFCLVLLSLFSFWGMKGENGVQVVKIHKQHTFPKTVPAGNYSGLCHIDGNRYAVVSDKAPEDGFFIFEIDIDSVTGDIKQVVNLGYRSSGKPNRDMEGVAYFPMANTIFISGEADNQIIEYDMNGKYTGRRLQVPDCFLRASKNYGLESLTYSTASHLFWTCSESTLKGDGMQTNATNGVRNRIRIQSFTEDLLPAKQYAYLMDKPKSAKGAYLYGMGISEMTDLDNGDLLVLEREFYTPPSKIGAFVINKIYQVSAVGISIEGVDTLQDDTKYLDKHFVCEWKTQLNLTKRDIANYEGMCLGPKLDDGSQVLLLLSDSQNQYGGILKDWFKSIVIKY